MSQGSFNPKIPRSKDVLCSPWTDTHTDTHESEYRGQPFRVSGMFPSTYHQGLVQYKIPLTNSKTNRYRIEIEIIDKIATIIVDVKHLKLIES